MGQAKQDAIAEGYFDYDDQDEDTCCYRGDLSCGGSGNNCDCQDADIEIDGDIHEFYAIQRRLERAKGPAFVKRLIEDSPLPF